MATIKSYTDISQSKKLAEILPLESADMAYIASATDDDGETLYTAEYKSEIIINEADDYINCWSLSALLSVLPYPDIKQYDGDWACRVENKDTAYLWVDINLVDACYEMILKLNEVNLL